MLSCVNELDVVLVLAKLPNYWGDFHEVWSRTSHEQRSQNGFACRTDASWTF
jgi:hypothetical protein